MRVSDMIDMTREVTNLFDKDVGEWNISVMLTELTGEVGTLADSIMIQERHRQPRDGDHIDLEDDIVDIIFMLIRIADYYKIDLEEAYEKMIQRTRKKLLNRLQAREYSKQLKH